MEEYLEFDQVRVDRLKEYKDKGWVVIDKVKKHNYDDGEKIEFLIGLPKDQIINQLKAIICDYERFGLREELNKKIAEENDDQIEDLKKNPSAFSMGYESQTAKYMSDYDKIVHDEKNVYAKSSEGVFPDF